MRKFALMGALATLVLSLAAATASAYSISPSGSFSASKATLGFTGPFGATMSCDVTLSGSLNATFSRGGSAGSITSANLANCTRGASVLFVNPTAWDIVATTVNESGGRVTDGLLTIVGVQFEVQNLPIIGTCLYSGNIGATATNPISALTVQTNSLPRVSGSSLCGNGAINAGQVFSLSPTQTIS